MIKAIIIIVLLSSIINLNAQTRDANIRIPLPGEVQKQHKLNDELTVPLFKKPDYYPAVKNSYGYIDTTYKIRYSNRFYDVNDWDSAYFVSAYVRDSTHYYYDPDHLELLGLMKVDYSGNVLWKRTDSVMQGDHFTLLNNSLIKLKDGNYLQAGFVDNDYNNWKHYDWFSAVFTKFDSNGDTIWQKLYNDTNYLKSGYWPQDIIPENDGGFTIAALILSDSKHLNPYDTSDTYLYTDTSYVGLIRYDSFGNEVYSQRHFLGGHPVITSIGLLMKQPDKGYVVGGVSYFSGDLKSYYLLKTDSMFNWEWKKTFGQTITSYPMIKIINNIKQNYFSVFRSDTPIVYDAYGNKYYNGYYQIGVMDTAFNIVKDTIFRLYLTNPVNPHYYDSGSLKGMVFSKNRNGITVCSDIGTYGANLVRLDSNLSFQWNQWIAQYPYFREEPYKMRRAHDGGYLIVGRSTRPGVGGWFVKTDSLGFALPNGADTLYHIGFEENGVTKSIDVKVYPNPTSDIINIVFDEIPKENIQTKLFDITGRLVFDKLFLKQNKFALNTNNLISGIYILNIKTSDNNELIIKIIKN